MLLRCFAAVVLLAIASPPATAAEKTLRIGTAMKQAGREAARRATRMGAPPSVVRQIERMSGQLAADGAQAHALNAVGWQGVTIERSPRTLTIRGDEGAVYSATVDAGTVYARGASGYGRGTRFEVQDGRIELDTASGQSRVLNRIGTGFTAAAGEIPAGSWMVYSGSVLKPVRYAVTPTGSRVKVTEPEWRGAPW